MSKSMRTPLGKVRGHGAGHAGTGHFIAQRLSALGLLILAPWFAINVALTMRDASYLSAIDFITQPVNAVGVILLIAVGLYHAGIGLQVVVEDYIHRPFAKAGLLVLNTFAAVAIGAGAIFAVLHLNFAGA